MHYNMKKLVEQYRNLKKGNSNLFAGDLIQLHDYALNSSSSINGAVWEGIIYSWEAGFMAGYNKAKKEARKERKAKNDI